MSHHALYFDGYDPITGMVRLYDPLADHGTSEDEGTVYRMLLEDAERDVRLAAEWDVTLPLLDEEPYRDRSPRETWEAAWQQSREAHR